MCATLVGVTYVTLDVYLSTRVVISVTGLFNHSDLSMLCLDRLCYSAIM